MMGGDMSGYALWTGHWLWMLVIAFADWPANRTGDRNG